jgi:hypothetical protein
MSDAWEAARKMAAKHSNQGGTFVRLANDGDKVVGAFCGEPFPREVHWAGDKYEDCAGPGCAHCEGGKKPGFRAMLNFFVPAESAMKVFEGSSAWYENVVRVRAKYGLDKWLFEIERHGGAGDPKTTYSVLPETRIDDAMAAKIAAAELHDLAALAGGGGGANGASSPAPTGRLIDPRAAGELVARLKALPRSQVDAFLSQFGVQRVRDIKASDQAAAEAFLARLEEPPSEPGEVDPFQ